MQDPWEQNQPTYARVPSPVSPNMNDVIKCVLEGVSFYVYDSNKMREITNIVAKRLDDHFGLELDIDIYWRPPQVEVSYKSNNNSSSWDIDV